MIDPNLNRPYVQQYSIGIQHDLKGMMVEARYVGNHVVGAYRAFDYNQVDIRNNGFLPDFQRARSNGFLALEQVGIFNPGVQREHSRQPAAHGLSETRAAACSGPRSS